MVYIVITIVALAMLQELFLSSAKDRCPYHTAKEIRLADNLKREEGRVYWVKKEKRETGTLALLEYFLPGRLNPRFYPGRGGPGPSLLQTAQTFMAPTQCVPLPMFRPVGGSAREPFPPASVIVKILNIIICWIPC